MANKENDEVIFSDKALSQMLERTEARTNSSFVEARAAATPESGAGWIDVGGTYAMFDGVGSPLTQTFGLGLFSEPTNAQFDELEQFFTEHGAEIFHEVSPLADASLMPILVDRGYRPIELSSILIQPLEKSSVETEEIATRITTPDEIELWARTSATGWSTEMEGLAEFMFEFGKISALTHGGFPFVAELDGKTAAAGMLFIYDEVALLAGASTDPEFRRRGAQAALLDARLRYAADHGCKIATMGASPGSQSQRNAEKNGFRIAYTRTKWMKA